MCSGLTGIELRARARLAAGVLLLTGASAPACRSDHRVSPWLDDLRLDTIAPSPDLEAQLQRIDAEMTHESMSRDQEIPGRFSDGTKFVIRSFVGTDAVRRRPRTAVRVATGYGVMLALGPAAPGGAGRPVRTELVAALADGGGWRSGTDLNGDGCPDMVVRGEDGSIELWCLMPRGASAYPVQSLVPPDHAVDVDEDGRPDLAARVQLGAGDAVSPFVLEVAVFQDGGYRADAEAAKSWHLREWRRLTVPADADAGGGSDRAPELTTIIETAWHALRAGRGKTALEEADAKVRARAPLAAGYAQSWVRWRGWLQDVSR